MLGMPIHRERSPQTQIKESERGFEMNKVLMPIGDASETVDTLYPYLRVQEDGFVPVVAAP